MGGEMTIAALLRNMSPKLNEGAYVFASLPDLSLLGRNDTLLEFKEGEDITVILSREKADELNIPYGYIAAWITLEVHSPLEATGFTAAFSTELAKHQISCNVVAGYYHDHLFVKYEEAEKAIDILRTLSKKGGLND